MRGFAGSDYLFDRDREAYALPWKPSLARQITTQIGNLAAVVEVIDHDDAQKVAHLSGATTGAGSSRSRSAGERAFYTARLFCRTASA